MFPYEYRVFPPSYYKTLGLCARAKRTFLDIVKQSVFEQESINPHVIVSITPRQ